VYEIRYVPTVGVPITTTPAVSIPTVRVARDLFDPKRWGLSLEAVHRLDERLYGFWERFAECFRAWTRDSSDYAYVYVSGLLRMEAKRNFANIARKANVPGQNIQHFMANSPWSAQDVIRQVQQEVIAKPGLQRAGVLILDESADEKAGDKSAGAARQYNGRIGKVDLSQVGVFLAYANLTDAVPTPTWLWVDGELFLPEHWFSQDEAMVKERKRLGIPEGRQFATKTELGWRMIERTVANGVRFELIAFDDNYGKSNWLRRKVNDAGHVYMADVPGSYQVYLTKPTVGVPSVEPDQKGRPPTRERVLSGEQPIKVSEVASREDTKWQRVRVRSIERGEINDEFAVRRVWTTRDSERGLPVSEEWLVIRRESSGRLNISLCNASAETTLERLTWMKCQRYFIERANQDAKSELGWDEFQAQKYRAWEHELALTILASWFVAETKLDWAHEGRRDPELARQLELEALPMLSTSNVREMLRATMPLPQLTPAQATNLVVQHLVNRARAKKSRMKHRPSHGPAP
jgi:SRSO17 transposase